MVGQKYPGGQGVQIGSPSAEYHPSGQGWGVEEVVVQLCARGHWRHWVCPPRVYVPRSQGIGVSSVRGHLDPGGHTVHSVLLGESEK